MGSFIIKFKHCWHTCAWLKKSSYQQSWRHWVERAHWQQLNCMEGHSIRHRAQRAISLLKGRVMF